MAQDLNERNINVNVIAPGPFKSKMTAPLYAGEKVEAEVMQGFTMGRWGATEDAAGLTNIPVVQGRIFPDRLDSPLRRRFHCNRVERIY